MARLNNQVDSDDELPELSSVLGPRTEAILRIHPKTPRHEQGDIASPKRQTQDPAIQSLSTGTCAVAARSTIKGSSHKPQSRDRRPGGHLKQTHTNSLLLPISNASVKLPKDDSSQIIDTVDGIPTRASPRKLATNVPEHCGLATVSANTWKSIHHVNDPYTGLSGFIVPDSDATSDEELSTSESPKQDIKQQKTGVPKSFTADPLELGFQSPKQPLFNTRQLSGTTISTLPEDDKISRMCLGSLPSNEPFMSEPVEAHHHLGGHYYLCPPRNMSPGKIRDDKNHTPTPPSNPLISKLKSPSKRFRIPPSPHRPSTDAFWSTEVINSWNEQYSPTKVVKSPCNIKLHHANKDEQVSPPEPSHKGPSKSPARKDKKLLEQRKMFDKEKHELAIAFLTQIDCTITKGQVASMADSTGGIRIIWSKKLSSTAGRANWRREAIHLRSAEGCVSDTTYRHHASIELAEKIIDNEGRLINVIAHEYCHLANFMISGVKDNPHGKDFKEWARKCNHAFSHRAINVTTKHTYTIAYKYIWNCMSPTCGLEYKRHSKSIDPSKHSCGNCRGKLMQIQPAPRNRGGDGKRTEYQDFVKQENERVRLENPSAGFGEIMSILGRDYKERKRNEVGMANVIYGNGALEKTGLDEPEHLESAVRKLNFLELGS